LVDDWFAATRPGEMHRPAVMRLQLRSIPSCPPYKPQLTVTVTPGSACRSLPTIRTARSFNSGGYRFDDARLSMTPSSLPRYGVSGIPRPVHIVPGTRRRVDLVFGRARVAVFVDGCFWHGCPEHGQRAHGVNGWYWPEKIAGNRRRDADTDDRLRAAGWAVVRVWEHDDPEQAATLIGHQVDCRLGGNGSRAPVIASRSSSRRRGARALTAGSRMSTSRLGFATP